MLIAFFLTGFLNVNIPYLVFILDPMCRYYYFTILIAILLWIGCSSESAREETAKDEIALDTKNMIKNADLVFLSVSDSEEALLEIRNTIGINEGIQEYISLDNSNELLLTHLAHQGTHHSLLERAKEVVELDLTYLDTTTIQPVFRVSIRHKVKDFQTWKWLYDGNQKARDKEGIVLIQMGTVKGDPNDVFVMFAIPDLDKARETMRDPDLLNKMKQGGVLGKPDIRFWRLSGDS
ncbi:MAG TPA: hypothetical protein DCX54_12395 [Flavobacteriales bacterium]|nr:hypothetical protein [Flavobacteriales bacterium]